MEKEENKYNNYLFITKKMFFNFEKKKSTLFILCSKNSQKTNFQRIMEHLKILNYPTLN